MKNRIIDGEINITFRNRNIQQTTKSGIIGWANRERKSKICNSMVYVT